MELKDRERKIDISKMDLKAVEDLSDQIGEKVRQICDEAAARVNAILNIYGASAKIAIAFDGLTIKKEDKTKAPTKRGKRGKQDNLK